MSPPLALTLHEPLNFSSPRSGLVQPGAAANRRPAGGPGDSEDLSAAVPADRAFPAAVAELGSFAKK